MDSVSSFVRDYLSVHEFTVLFSGGKDSTAALLWVANNVPHERWDVLYIEVTGNTHPLCNQYVYEVIEALGLRHRFRHAKREDLDFFEALRRWGVPIRNAWRWCLWQFKMRLIQRYARPIQVNGIRRSDSARRKKIAVIHYFRLGNCITVQPIYDWSDRQVEEYIRQHGLTINPCYGIYKHSGNCMFCPYYSIDMIRRTMADPVWGPMIAEILRELAEHGHGWVTREVAKKWLRYTPSRSLLEYVQQTKVGSHG